MHHDHRVLEDEACPVSDEALGALYRCSPHGLAELIGTISPNTRGMLALYCYRRAHLNAIGLAIAATCDEENLIRWGGRAGVMLFAKSREAPQLQSDSSHPGRRKITLTRGPLRRMGPIDIEETES
jgi:hypothetical protein